MDTRSWCTRTQANDSHGPASPKLLHGPGCGPLAPKNEHAHAGIVCNTPDTPRPSNRQFEDDVWYSVKQIWAHAMLGVYNHQLMGLLPPRLRLLTAPAHVINKLRHGNTRVEALFADIYRLKQSYIQLAKEGTECEHGGKHCEAYTDKPRGHRR